MSKGKRGNTGEYELMNALERELAAEDEAKGDLDNDADDCAPHPSEAAVCFDPYGLGDRRTWSRMLLGYVLILAYVGVTTGLAWAIAHWTFGTWGVPAGQELQGSWAMYLMALMIMGGLFTPIALFVLFGISFGAYKLGQMIWPVAAKSLPSEPVQEGEP